MNKKIHLLVMALLWSSASLLAQVPSYVPTNGLVGYWPFNGNANDASGNGNNGTVNGASLTVDRYGNFDKSFSFDGVNDYIRISDNSTSSLDLTSNYSLSAWVNMSGSPSSPHIITKHIGNIDNLGTFTYSLQSRQGGYYLSQQATPNFNSSTETDIPGVITLNTWYHFSCTYDKINQRLIHYINGIPSDTITTIFNIQNTSIDLLIGASFVSSINNLGYFWSGKLDDIGIWNRALTAQEITNLYRGCGDSIITNQPTNVYVGVGLNAQFTTTSKTGSTYQWQTNSNHLGWQNIPANSYYIGVNSNTLGVNTISVSNHNQAFRVLVDAGGCKDTSSMAYIKVADTCLTTVTDTLIIKTTVGLPTPNITNTLLIYPNPAKDRITIDNGNYTVMAGYSIKIENSLGQQVFNSAITQAQFNIDLSTWTGKGIYYVRVLDTQGNVVTTRKILLQ